MAGLTRRDLFKSSAAVTAASVVPPAHAAHRRAKAHKAVMPVPSVRERLLLDFGWRFHLGHACDQDKDFGFGLNQHTYAKAGDVTAAATLEFDDSAWTQVNLPHDWAVELPFAPSKNPPPAGQDDPRAAHGFKPLGREYPDTSIGWYRRVFDLPASDLGRRLSLEFDGVFRNALVMFNGYIIAGHGDGYTPFRVDVSDFANYGGKNVLTVRVDASLGEGWFYEGAGIYRHVWLVKADPLHIPQWGSWVRSEITGSMAALTVSTELVNEGLAVRKCQVVSTVLDPKGRAVASWKTQPLTIGTQEMRTLVQHMMVRGPALWSLENPQLYQLVTKVHSGNKVIDEAVVSFGVRSIRFDPEKGFFLNSKPVKLNGTCNHQDHAGVGAAVPDRLQYWRIERLKEFGCNAYRSSHNPPAPELLEACDRLGMLVIDETRRMSSDEESMADLACMIRRDRNHPSVILWSIGNEEQGQQGTERGARIATTMKRLCNELDPTRSITAAVDNPDVWGLGVTPVVDVLGGNYRTDKIPAFHARNPTKPMIGTETGSTVSTRGVYLRDPASGYCVAYDTEFPWWASTAEGWLNVVAKAPFIAGGFVWTGFDYRGEPTPFNAWPNVASQFGIVDSCGFPKDNTFYYKAWWGREPVLHLFPHWNWQGKEGQKVNVWVHTNLDRVELFVNGQSQGVRNIEPCKHVEWDVAYAPGVIVARGYRNGKQVLTAKRETTGAPAKVQLGVDRTLIHADGEDVFMVTAEIQDAQGRMVPTANNMVAFNLTGPGTIIGVGNGDPRSHEPDKGASRSAFNGLCMAIVQATKQQGDIWLEATSPGLTANKNVVTSIPANPRPAVA
jgi:beta-galactosidase